VPPPFDNFSPLSVTHTVPFFAFHLLDTRILLFEQVQYPPQSRLMGLPLLWTVVKEDRTPPPPLFERTGSPFPDSACSVVSFYAMGVFAVYVISTPPVSISRPRPTAD